MVRDSGVAVRAVDIEIVTLLRNGRKKSAEGISMKDVRKILEFLFTLCALLGQPPHP